MSTIERVRFLATHVTRVLVGLAAIATIAAGAEIWRYVLLWESQSSALPRGTVTTSDALVITTALLAVVVAVTAIALTLWWLFAARIAASELAGYQLARADWQVLAGVLIPGWNFIAAGSILAELEHAVLRLPAKKSPRPSLLLVVWWAGWVLTSVLCMMTIWWRFRSSVQAQADLVLLSAFANLVAAGMALVTVLVVHRLTALIAPIDPKRARRFRIVKVLGAPDPPLRPLRSAGSSR